MGNFEELMRRVRAKDPMAREEFVRRYSNLIRMIARVKLTDHMRRFLDSEDICQSVLYKFLDDYPEANVSLDEPGKVIGYLATSARNRVQDHFRRLKSRRLTNQAESGDESSEVPDPRAVDPVEDASAREQAEIDRKRYRDLCSKMNEEEQQLVNFEVEGRSWREIADIMGGTPDARRMQYQRLLSKLRG